jgi:hypothetical protein
VDVGPIPRYKQCLLNETDRYMEFLTETGAKARRSKEGDYAWYNMPMFVEFPVSDRKTWSEYKKRLNPEDARRYPKDWDSETYIRICETLHDDHSMLRMNGFYGF